MAEKRPIDWEAIEREYRAGQMSLRAIGLDHGITEGAIRKRAKAQGWDRDLTEKVREAVRTKLVRDEGTQAHERVPDRDAIETAAQRGASVVREHRKDIKRGRNLASILFDQLASAIDHRPELEDAIWDETVGDKKPDRRNFMLKAVSLPAHATALRDLSTALKNFVPLERQAFNLDAQEREGQDDPLQGLTDALRASREARA